MLRLIMAVLLLPFLLPAHNYGQNMEDSDALLTQYFEKAKNGSGISISTEDLKAIPFQQIIAQAKSFLQDENPFVRYKAIDLIKRAGSYSGNPENRKLTISLLIEASKDHDGGNSGTASAGLLLFNLDDFSDTAADSIAALLKIRRFHYERIIHIAGFLQNDITTKALNNLKTGDSTLTKKEKWAVELALARTGNDESLQYCLDKIRSVPVNDNTINYLFPDLIYMRQPEAMNYMLQEVLSDEKKCRSSNPDKEEEIICAFRIIELVAPVIEDFPVKMTSYGEIDTDNFDLTLHQARAWISGHNSYSLIGRYY